MKRQSRQSITSSSVCALVSLLGLACGDAGNGAATASAAGTTGQPTGAGATDGGTAELPTTDASPSDGSHGATQGADGFGDCDIDVDEAQIDCALDLLIAGEPGVVKWVYSSDQGFSTSGGFVQILPERQGLTRTWSFVDLSGEDSAAGVVPLRPADYFQGCKDLPTGAQRFGCMTDWSEDEPTAQCDEAGYRSDI